MSASFERRLRALDRALVALVEERLRLRGLARDAARADAGTGPGAGPATALEDLLRRHEGELSAERVRALFAALDALTEPAPPRAPDRRHEGEAP